MALDPLSIGSPMPDLFSRADNVGKKDAKSEIDAGNAGVVAPVMPNNGWLSNRVVAVAGDGDADAFDSGKVTGPSGRTPTAAVVQAPESPDKPTTYVGGIDRRRFLDELRRNPGLITKAAWMVRGEIGNSAPLSSKIAMLETAFNRAQVRGHSLEQALLSVGESRKGYYATETYGGAPPSRAEVEDFKRNVLAPVLAGSDVSSAAGLGPMTGNASGSVAEHQIGRRTPGYGIRAAGHQTEFLFNEEHKDLKNGPWLPRLNEATAAQAAQQAVAAIPNGVFPTNPMSAITGGVQASDAARLYGSNEIGKSGAARGKRIYNPIPLERPIGNSASNLNLLAALLESLGLSPAQVARFIQLLQDPAFQNWLGNRPVTPQLMKAYLNTDPGKFADLRADLGRALDTLSALSLGSADAAVRTRARANPVVQLFRLHRSNNGR
jgi:hypothetical protein